MRSLGVAAPAVLHGYPARMAALARAVYADDLEDGKLTGVDEVVVGELPASYVKAVSGLLMAEPGSGSGEGIAEKTVSAQFTRVVGAGVESESDTEWCA